jgi:hypothetical protein
MDYQSPRCRAAQRLDCPSVHCTTEKMPHVPRFCRHFFFLPSRTLNFARGITTGSSPPPLELHTLRLAVWLAAAIRVPEDISEARRRTDYPRLVGRCFEGTPRALPCGSGTASQGKDMPSWVIGIVQAKWKSAWGDEMPIGFSAGGGGRVMRKPDGMFHVRSWRDTNTNLASRPVQGPASDPSQSICM